MIIVVGERFRGRSNGKIAIETPQLLICVHSSVYSAKAVSVLKACCDGNVPVDS